MSPRAKLVIERVIRDLRQPRIALTQWRLQQLADELDAALTFEGADMQPGNPEGRSRHSA